MGRINLETSLQKTVNRHVSGRMWVPSGGVILCHSLRIFHDCLLLGQSGWHSWFLERSMDLVILQLRFPQLFSFCKNPNIISVKAFVNSNVSSIFWLPLSAQATDELADLLQLITDHGLASDPDQWTYIWGTTIFTAKQAYSALRGTMPTYPLFKWLWKSKAHNTHKFFLWLLLQDRLNKMNILRRKNIYLDSFFERTPQGDSSSGHCHCAMTSLACTWILMSVFSVLNMLKNTRWHLFFGCPFSQVCWIFLGINWDDSMDPLHMIAQARQDFGSRKWLFSLLGSVVSQELHHLC